MAKVCTLYSGSSGNSTYIGSECGGLLVDIGKNCKQTVLQLQSRGIEPESLGGILITHEHIDHVRGLKVFLKKYHTPLYTTTGTAGALRMKDLLQSDYPVHYIEEETPFEIQDMQISAMRTSHDCADSMAYRVRTARGKKVTVATDMGQLPDGFIDKVADSDLIVLESNYDENMLRSCDYPYFLKRRIFSDCGHLSNDLCAQTVCTLTQRGVPRFMLAHLSINSNAPEVAYQTTACQLQMMGADPEGDLQLSVAPRDTASPLWEL
ncbi:MBL fold metallo-hydrolase [Neobittarella massiliensis]|uniref:MBL fold metallo-hydrolase n=2 Tax=Oscillospiraceae TaxID=216572 RepID=A0A8J6IKX0_9FIRM|nr:MBL fold metallo-hydrolase [Neobittarella massiliensis]MBC3516491.1 MBL fold metallo-hydrolase [Neobittarella massiliensis]SCJ88427.1 ribonuclease Z [uncultured Anaerotruncus sp.]